MGTDFRIRPLADRVVLKQEDRQAQTKGGIFLPDTASTERPMEGADPGRRRGAPGRHRPARADAG